MRKHLCITVTGRVQGVYYRGSTERIALGFQLTGYVKNQCDDTVYIEAEGTESNLRKLIEWCRRGPENAIVERIEVEEGEMKNYTGFHVRY